MVICAVITKVEADSVLQDGDTCIGHRVQLLCYYELTLELPF